MEDIDFTYMILLLGDPSTRKEEFCEKHLAGSSFKLNDLKLTIGVDFYSKYTYYKDKKIKLQIWDVGVEERFRFLFHQVYNTLLFHQYCKPVKGALIMYDITNSRTLEHLSERVQIIRENAGDIPIMLVGNKIDLEDLREVLKQEVIEMVRSYNLSAYREISTKTGHNIEELFEEFVEILIKNLNYPKKKKKFKKKVKGTKEAPIDFYQSDVYRPAISQSIRYETRDYDATSPFRGIGHATFKIVIFGDSEVAKAKLTQRFLTDLFISDSKMTIGVDFEVKSIIVEGKRVKLKIWDLGEKRFRFLLPYYVRGAQGGLFVYDVNNYPSLRSIDEWLSIIKKGIKSRDEFPIMVVGIRSGIGKNRQVSAEEGMKIAKSRGLDGFIECSVETGENGEEVFEALTRLMIDRTFI